MGTYDVIKDGAKILKEAGKIDEYTKILELLQENLDRQKIIICQEEKIKGLEEKIKIKGEILLKNNAYWLNEKGPYCPRCYDVKNILVSIFPRLPGRLEHSCSECKNNFTIKES